MRRLNVRLSLWLLGISVLVAGCGAAVHWLQTGRIARALLWQAARAEEQGRPDQAVRYVARYLEFVPKDTEQRARAGRILATDPKDIDISSPDAPELLAKTARNRHRAQSLLTEVLIGEPNRHDSRRLLARVLIDLNEPEKALEHLAVLQKALPADGEVQELLGDCHAARQKYAEAAAAWWKAAQLAPKQRNAYIKLSVLLRDHKEVRSAAGKTPDQVIDLLVANNADDYRAYLARWEHREKGADPRTKPSPESAADVRKAVELAPHEAEVLLAAAMLHQRQREFDQARQGLAEGRKLHPKDARMVQALFRLEIEAAGGAPEQIVAGREKAVAVLTDGLRAMPSHPQLLWNLANLLLDAGKLDQAMEQINRLAKTNPAPEAVDYLQARVAIKQKKWDEATRLLQRTRPQLERSGIELLQEVDVMLAACYAQLEEPAGQLAALERATRRNPDRASGHLGLAANLWEAGQYDRAVAEMRQGMAQKDAPPSGWTDLARMLIIRNLQQRAADQDWKTVEDALDHAAKLGQPAVDLVLLRAEVFKATGRTDAARKLLTEERDRDPSKVEFWAALAELEDRQKRPDEAWKLLTEAVGKTGDVVTLRLAKARHLAERGTDAAKQELPKLGQDVEKFSEADRAVLYRGLTEAYYAVGQLEEAQRTWERFAKLPGRSDDLRVQMARLDLAVRADDDGALPGIVEVMKRIEGTGGNLWAYAESVRLIRLARKTKDEGPRGEYLEQARGLLDQVITARPNWPLAWLARKDLELLKGNPEQAIASYRKAVDLGDRNPQVVRGLVELLYQRMRDDEARQEIARMEAQAPLSPDMRRLASMIAVGKQDFKQAQEFLQTVAENSSDYHDHLWHGQILSASGQADEAERKLRRAVELGSEAPEAWVALVRHLVAVDQQGRAREALKEAATKLPAGKQALALAQCHELLGDLDEARKQYEAARKARPEDMMVLRVVVAFYLRDRRMAEAAPLLRQVAERKLKVEDADVEWARRGLAVVLADQRDPAQFVEALALIGLGLDAKGQMIETNPKTGHGSQDLRARAQVLAAWQTKACRAKALGYLDELARRKELAPDDQYLQAQLLEMDGAPARAREALRSLAATQKLNPLYVGAYAQLLLRQGRATEAQPLIDDLEKLERSRSLPAGAFGSIELRVRVLEAHGEGRKAVELLRTWAERKGARPEDRLALIAGLARTQRTGEALDVCEKASDVLPPAAVCGAAVAVLRAGKPTPEQLARVDRWLESAASKDARGAVFLLQRADLMDLQGRLDRAEDLYRQVVKLEPSNPVALNNLSWLLAQKPNGGAEALPLIERAVQVYGPRAEFLDTRSTVLLALGKTQEAIADLKQANLDSPSPSRQFRLAAAYHAAHDRQSAREALQKAVSGGLRPEHLHPVEQVAYRKVAEELKQ